MADAHAAEGRLRRSVPLNAAGRGKVADAWDPSKDGMCEAYGVGGLMRMPARLRISWQDDNDAEDRNRRRPADAAAAVRAPARRRRRARRADAAGHSVAEWQRSGGAFDAFLERGAGAGAASAGARSR